MGEWEGCTCVIGRERGRWWKGGTNYSGFIAGEVYKNKKERKNTQKVKEKESVTHRCWAREKEEKESSHHSQNRNAF